MFDNGSDFNPDLTPLLKVLYIKPILTTFKNPQDNAPVEWVHQVILNMLVTKDLDKKFFNHIYSWGETLASIAWVIRNYYYRNIMATTGQAVFDREMLFFITSVIYWQAVTTAKHCQVGIVNVRENSMRVMHD